MTCSELKDNDILLYVDHLEQLSCDMEARFRDLLDVDIPAWILYSSVVNAADVDVRLQELIIEFQNYSFSTRKTLFFG